MLDLSEAHLIHRGANRACYRHPGAADRCIKVDLPGGEGTRQGLNAIEFEHYGDLVRRAGEALYRHAPRCHGYVETSLGPGLCFELIRDADGNASERFDRYISLSGCSCDDALALIDRLYGFVREAGVMLFDVNLHNLLVRVGPTRGVGGGVELVAIDWKGMRALHEWLPVSSVVPWFARRKMARRFARLRVLVRTHFERKGAAGRGVTGD